MAQELAQISALKQGCEHERSHGEADQDDCKTDCVRARANGVRWKCCGCAAWHLLVAEHHGLKPSKGPGARYSITIRGFGQACQHPLEHPLAGPSTEAPEDRVPASELRAQIASGRAGADDPEHRFQDRRLSSSDHAAAAARSDPTCLLARAPSLRTPGGFELHEPVLFQLLRESSFILDETTTPRQAP